MPLRKIDIAIFALLLLGPVLAYIGMRRYHVKWTSKDGVLALIAGIATVISGAVLFWLR